MAFSADLPPVPSFEDMKAEDLARELTEYLKRLNVSLEETFRRVLLAARSTKNSVEVDVEEFQLVNDESAPGNSKYYGTDGSGDKGWHALP